MNAIVHAVRSQLFLGQLVLAPRYSSLELRASATPTSVTPSHSDFLPSNFLASGFPYDDSPLINTWREC